MKQCEDARAQIAFYLDDELKGEELRSFEAHITACADCRVSCGVEGDFLALVRASRPLYVAPPELRGRVERTLSNVPAPYAASPELRQRVEKSLWPKSAGVFHLSNVRRAALLTLTAAFILAAVWTVALRGDAPAPRPSDFALIAVETQQRYLRGQLPLEITSASPEKISGWFKNKVSFGLKLPSYQEASGQEKLYSLEGARLIWFKDYTAYVAYRMQGRPISLVVTCNSLVMPSGGKEIKMGAITFHYDSIDGYDVMTWADRGLTYALVSDLEERGLQSCLVCHQGTKDFDFLEALKPKGD